ncbi:hypothetical protein ETB97_010370 [Aspergillus alliaceus]|uniref:NmrA-like domain-containing protein n=1 Tax=Petromyces alliaceus TaxID=209559 RepID=A0A8H6ACB0_PETAA|nr:hypothetical protein ETB97_010370 [Aspergillus burnettii]
MLRMAPPSTLKIQSYPQNATRMSASKLLIKVGITGKQEFSVANSFLNLPDGQIRGITRNPSSVAAQEWISKGVQLVKASLDDIASLPRACLPRSLRHFRRY